jgi:TorA maturation chaperone TorD
MASRAHHGEPDGPSVPGAGGLAMLMGDRAALPLTLDRFAGAFTALSGLLVTAPDGARLDRVRDEELLGDWPLQEDPESRRGLGLMRESVLANESEGEIRRDYNRLFFGPAPMVAPPYESVYRSEERLVFELQTMQVRASYARFGLAAPRLNKEPDDHIGLELGFLGVLCVQAMDAIDSGDDVELTRLVAGVQTFLELHLLVWGPHCLTLVANGSQTFFYRSVAALGLGALQDAQTAFQARPGHDHRIQP